MIRLLKCALALDAHRNFARAAEDLGISQPSLTRSIQELELQFGAKLFDRSHRAVLPTPIGVIVLNGARRVCLDVADLKREVALYQGLHVGELKIGVGPLVAQTWLGDAVGALLAEHPELGMRLLDLDWWDIPDALRSRQIDLAVGDLQEASEDPGIAVEPLPHRPASFYCRTGHPLLRIKKPTICDIGAFPLVAPKMPSRSQEFLASGKEMGRLASNGRYFSPRIQCQNFFAISRIVAASNAVGVATVAKLVPLVAAGGFHLIKFQAEWLRTNYAIMHLRDRALAPAAIAFCAAARAAEHRYNETVRNASRQAKSN